MTLPENSGASKRVKGEIYPVRPTARSIFSSYTQATSCRKRRLLSSLSALDPLQL
jgi:hypothetical protein